MTRRRAKGMAIVAAVATLVLTAIGCRTASAPPDPELPPSPATVPGESSADETAEPEPEEPAPPLTYAARIPETIRVGLRTDRVSVSLGCCELHAEWDGTTYAVTHPLTVEPAAERVRAPVYRLQVAALRDEEEARDLAARLRGLVTWETVVRFDAETGLYRVRTGAFADRETAAAGSEELASHGVAEAWVVSEGGGVTEPALRVHQGETSKRLPGRWLAISDRGDDGIPYDGGRYRGRILIYLNDRGTLNVINELSLEDYLRGVVPREMGPDIYPELEALKAQAVAARSYTVRTLGEFDEEGFDICATPRCQVYGGMEIEHALSDRAVRETAGEVLLWDGVPIAALYSSTCGGHTEDVELVFPLRSAPYLRGVACIEAGVTRIEGGGGATTLPESVMERVVPSSGRGADAFAARLRRLARRAGLTPSPEFELEGLDASAVRRAVVTGFDLVLDARFFIADEDLPYLLVDPPSTWTAEERRLAAFFVTAGLDGGGEGPLDRRQRAELLLRLAERLDVVEVRSARFDRFGADRVLFARDEAGEPTGFVLDDRVATFRHLQSSDERPRREPLALVAGDELELYLVGDRVVALVQRVHRGGTGFDRASRWSSWRRFRSDATIAAAARERFPGFSYRGFELGPRGVSGRVSALTLTGDDGERRRVEGLPVRWFLDLPDTRFTARRLEPGDGPPGWLFHGSGWGHGVGLCQVGAHGMAVRGHDYREILHHYYTDVEVEVLETVGEDRSRPTR